jgi:SNF2 family DNA or RNA helicase
MGRLGVKHAVAFEESLRPYQREGVSFLVRAESALLADEMGLGKTVQAAFALRLALRQPIVNRALIVVPASLALNWQRELERWAPELTVRRLVGTQRQRSAYYDLPVPVLIGSYEQIAADALDRIPEGAFDLVLLDEAQRIKNHSSRTALACRLLPRRIAWALTGTPIENSRADLESIFAFLRPGLIRTTDGRTRVLEAIAPYYLRRKKKDVAAEMPPIIYQDLSLELNEAQRQAYHAAWSSGTDKLRSAPHPVAATALLALITKLKQVCNFESVTGDSCKLDALRLLLEDAMSSGTKVLLFSQYVQTLKWLAERLHETPTSLYIGEQTQGEKDGVLAEYAESPGHRLLLASLRAGGIGINIPQADLVILFDRWWNPALEAQAVNRAHRLGRQAPVHVVRFLVRDTVEERIDAILASKQLLFEDYVEAIESDDVQLLSRNDLISALDLSHFDTDVETMTAALE